MAAYRFRITFEDHDDVYRDVEIKPNQTFEDFHFAIQEAIGFDNKHKASFYLSDDNWKKGHEITIEDISDDENGKKRLHMKSSKLSSFISDPHQKFLYIYDFMEMWIFRIELVKIVPTDENNIRFPRCVRSIGEAPKQYATTTIPKAVPESEFVEEEVYDLSESEGLEGEENINVEAPAETFSELDPAIEEEKTDLDEL